MREKMIKLKIMSKNKRYVKVHVNSPLKNPLSSRKNTCFIFYGKSRLKYKPSSCETKYLERSLIRV